MSKISLPTANALPAEMVQRKQWVAWKYVKKQSSTKPTKVPFHPDNYQADTTLRGTWTSFTNITAKVGKANGRFDGIGFVFSQKDDFAGVDLDNCLTPDGSVMEWAKPLLPRFSGTYMEVSPSGRGIKIFCRGALPQGRKIEFFIDGEKCTVEAYSWGRFFTVTGRRWQDAPLDMTPHQGDIEMALAQAAKLAKPSPAAEAAAGSSDHIAEGGRHDALKKMAVKMKLAGMTGDEIQDALLSFNQHRCSPPKPDQEVRDIVKWVAEHRFDGSVDPATLPKLAGVNGETLYAKEVAEAQPIVEGFLYAGCTIFCGRPKQGKSWLMLQTALAVAAESKIADRLPVKQPGKVLYLALEESEARTIRRIHKLTQASDFLRDITFIYRSQIEAAANGGIIQIEQYLQTHPGVRLVVIDTLLAFQRIERKKTNDLLLSDYNQIQPLQELAAKYDCCIVIVDHSRKMGGDAIDVVSGSTGKTAAPDSVMTLQRQKDGNTSLLTVMSRDMEEQTYQLQLDTGSRFGWHILAQGEAAKFSTSRKEVIDVLRDEPMRPKDLARALGKTEAAVRMLLKRLADDSAVNKDKDGRYHAL